MNNENPILIRNIYYMLSYAFRVLKEKTYDSVEAEGFDHIHDLFASILTNGMKKQVKQGLFKEYVDEKQDIKTLKGKLNLKETIYHKVSNKQLLSCEFDELSEDNLFNQIIKKTIGILLKHKTVKSVRKSDLRKIMFYLVTVKDIEVNEINWNTLKFHRHNMHYRMIINICYLIIDGLLMSEEQGQYKLMNFLDEQKMSSLFERFVLEYYRFHHHTLSVSAPYIEWIVNEGELDFLPVMKTDIMIKNKFKTLIIDTKFYSKSMKHRKEYDSYKLHSNNLYQIFTYVKNEDKEQKGNVSGLLLYARTTESIAPNADFLMDGNKISVKTLDLNVSFKDIAKTLDSLVSSFY